MDVAAEADNAAVADAAEAAAAAGAVEAAVAALAVEAAFEAEYEELFDQVQTTWRDSQELPLMRMMMKRLGKERLSHQTRAHDL